MPGGGGDIGGEEADRMLMLLDGSPVVLPVRLLGAFSVFNPLVMRSLLATSSGFSAAHGNAFPAGIHLRTREDHEKATLRGLFDLAFSTVAGGATLGGPRPGAVTGALRISHMDAVSPLLPREARRRVRAFAPRLGDAYLAARVAASEGVEVELQTLGTSENGSLDSYERSFAYRWRKAYVRAGASAAAGDLLLRAGVSWSHDDLGLESDVPLENLQALRFSTSGRFNLVRAGVGAEWRLGEQVLAAGSDLTVMESRLDFASSSSWLDRQSLLRQVFADPAVYAEAAFLRLPFGASLTAGARVSYFDLPDRVGVEPRVEASWNPAEETRLVIRWGHYLGRMRKARPTAIVFPRFDVHLPDVCFIGIIVPRAIERVPPRKNRVAEIPQYTASERRMIPPRIVLFHISEPRLTLFVQQCLHALTKD
ncbi:MAG: hypothetical protein WB626_04830 [Bacteroidota bacterium]